MGEWMCLADFDNNISSHIVLELKNTWSILNWKGSSSGEQHCAIWPLHFEHFFDKRWSFVLVVLEETSRGHQKNACSSSYEYQNHISWKIWPFGFKIACYASKFCSKGNYCTAIIPSDSLGLNLWGPRLFIYIFIWVGGCVQDGQRDGPAKLNKKTIYIRIIILIFQDSKSIHKFEISIFSLWFQLYFFYTLIAKMEIWTYKPEKDASLWMTELLLTIAVYC